AGAATARIWLFYTEASLSLWPQQWRSDGIRTAGGEHNYIEVKANSAGQVVLTDAPFLWTPLRTQSHHCLIAIAENAPLSNPPQPPLPQGTFGSFDALTAFIEAHPNMAWRNVVELPPSASGMWQNTVSIAGSPQGETLYVGIQCHDMPTDGFFAYQ